MIYLNLYENWHTKDNSQAHTKGVNLEDIDLDLNHFSAIYQILDTYRKKQYFNISKLNSDLTKSVSDLAVNRINISSHFPKLDHFLALIRQLNVKFDV